MIETRGLRKSFRSKRRRRVTIVEAVRGVDLIVAEGEIFGFLGPNGAGKTTTLRMLATLLPPDGGDATIAGADLLASPREVRRRIGYVAQGGGTWDEVSAREELALQARMYGTPKAEAWERAAAAMESFGLSGVLLPIALAPLWLKRVADWNPFYWATAGMRALFAGHPGQAVVWEGAVTVIALAVVALSWSGWLFARALR